jgi:hypothetical protein
VAERPERDPAPDAARDPDPDPALDPAEEQKAKFREALARKQKKADHPTGTKHGGPDHTHGEHGAYGGRRDFRRKSG